MSQKRQTTEEVMAAREAMENLPENVTPLPFAEPTAEEEKAYIDRCEDDLFDEADLPSAEEVQKSLEEAMEANAEAPEETEGPDAVTVECPYCGSMVACEVDDKLDDDELAAKFCKCNQAKTIRNSARMTEKIDMLFGPGSKSKYGFPEEHDSEELSILKQVGSLVAQRKIKGIAVTLENGDKAVIQTIKDTTKVRHTKATKAEAEA